MIPVVKTALHFLSLLCVGLCSVLFLALFSAFFSTTSFAFRVSPMVVNFTPAGSGSTQNFMLENTSHGRIAVQVEAFHRFIDVDGKETRTPTDEFSVYPQQLTLQPGEKRSVRVTWTGNHQPDQELSYRLVVSELPMDSNSQEKTSSPHPAPTFLMQYVASLYVSPPSLNSKVEVESFKVLSDSRGELILKNTGLLHQVLKGIRLFFRSADGSKVELKNEETEALQGENLLANASRHIYLTLPASVVRAEKAKPGSVTVEIQL
jgi:fimbrial chaperone protein